MKLTTHLHLVPRSRSVELYLHSPDKSSWRGAYLSTGTTLYFYLCSNKELRRTFGYMKVKVKVQLSLRFFLNRAPRHEGVLGYSSTHSLTSAVDGGEWSASCPGCYTSRERALCIHWTGGWVRPIAVLNAAVKRKIPSPCWESNPTISIVRPVAQRYAD
jgi:hypothetical protein